jgi:hypothetical protein
VVGVQVRFPVRDDVRGFDLPDHVRDVARCFFCVAQLVVFLWVEEHFGFEDFRGDERFLLLLLVIGGWGYLRVAVFAEGEVQYRCLVAEFFVARQEGAGRDLCVVCVRADREHGAVAGGRVGCAEGG